MQTSSSTLLRGWYTEAVERKKAKKKLCEADDVLVHSIGKKSLGQSRRCWKNINFLCQIFFISSASVKPELVRIVAAAVRATMAALIRFGHKSQFLFSQFSVLLFHDLLVMSWRSKSLASQFLILCIFKSVKGVRDKVQWRPLLD